MKHVAMAAHGRKQNLDRKPEFAVHRVAICDRFRELGRGESWPGSNTIINLTCAPKTSRIPVGRLLQIIPLDGPRCGSTSLMRISLASGPVAILDGAFA